MQARSDKVQESSWMAAAVVIFACLCGCAPSGRSDAAGGGFTLDDSMDGTAHVRVLADAPGTEVVRAEVVPAPAAEAPAGARPWALDYVDGTVGVLGCAQ